MTTPFSYKSPTGTCLPCCTFSHLVLHCGCFMNHTGLRWHFSAVSHGFWSGGERDPSCSLAGTVSLHRASTLSFNGRMSSDCLFFIILSYGTAIWDGPQSYTEAVSAVSLNSMCVHLFGHRRPMLSFLHSSLYWTPHCVSGFVCWPDFQHICGDTKENPPFPNT